METARIWSVTQPHHGLRAELARAGGGRELILRNIDMTMKVGQNISVESYNVAQAKARLSEILERVSDGEEILLTRRGKPIARLIPAAHTVGNILGTGRQDANINFDVLATDEWWKPISGDEAESWYE